MRLSIVLLAVLLAMPLSAGAPNATPDAAQKGLDNACAKSPNGGPCKLAGNHVANTTVHAGETRSYSDGSYVVDGTVHVESGGSVESHNATLTFAPGSLGFIVDTGGSLRLDNDTLQGQACDCVHTFGLDLAPGSVFFMRTTHVLGGVGVRLATSSADVALNVLESIPRALFLDNVTLTIHDNAFVADGVGINATGGQPVMDHNTFQATHDCIRDYQTDPTITHNVMVGCIVGIWHEQSHSYIAFNKMTEDEDPTSVGIAVVNGNSPVVEGNDITNFTTGILVDHARAYLRNNTIHHNVGDGIRVVANSMPMDIQGNHVYANGGEGIHLVGASDVALFHNVVEDNADFGYYLVDATSVTLANEAAYRNRVGVLIAGESAVTIASTNASGNELDGFNFEAGTTLDHGVAIGNGRAGVYMVLGGSSAANGWYEGNALAGVINNEDNPVADAKCSYWGSVSGPTANDNPNGDGDAVYGAVQYRPFATQPGAACETVAPVLT